MCDNPLCRSNPANTLESCIDHTEGMIEITEKMAGKGRTDKADFAINNGFKTAVNAMKTVYKTIAPHYLDDDQDNIVAINQT